MGSRRDERWVFYHKMTVKWSYFFKATVLVLCLLIICENLPNSNLILTDLSPLWEKLNLHYKGFNRSWSKSYFMKCFSYPRFLQAWRSFESRKLCYLPLSSFFIKPISRLYHYYKAIEQMEKREGNRSIWYMNSDVWLTSDF